MKNDKISNKSTFYRSFILFNKMFETTGAKIRGNFFKMESPPPPQIQDKDPRLVRTLGTLCQSLVSRSKRLPHVHLKVGVSANAPKCLYCVDGNPPFVLSLSAFDRQVGR